MCKQISSGKGMPIGALVQKGSGSFYNYKSLEILVMVGSYHCFCSNSTILVLDSSFLPMHHVEFILPVLFGKPQQEAATSNVNHTHLGRHQENLITFAGWPLLHLSTPHTDRSNPSFMILDLNTMAE